MTPHPDVFGPAALWLIVLVPAVAGAALLLSPLTADPGRGARGAVPDRAGRVAVPVSLVAAAVTVVLSLVAAVRRPDVAAPFVAGTDFALRVDALSALVLPTVTLVTLLVLVFAVGDIREGQARFHGLMLIFAASACLTVTAATLPSLLMGWEVMGATSYALIGFWWRKDPRVSAGLTAFLTTRAADLGLYLAAAAALAGGGGLSLTGLEGASAGWRHVIAFGVLVAALGKAAQLPFSFWLSRAMEGPSPVSALLHSAAMVAMGGYLLLRVAPLLAVTGWAATVTAWAGALTALVLGVVAVAQTDLKQLLAASTAAQLGFVVMAAGVGAVAGGTAQLVAHAATKAVLFLAAGAWLSALGTKNLAGLGGVARRWPLVGWTATVGAASLAGLAPLSLWATKDAVLTAARETSGWLYLTGLLAAVLSAAYAVKVIVVVWRTPSPAQAARVRAHPGEERPGTGHVNRWQKAPLVILAAGAAGLGLLSLPPVGPVLARTLGNGGAPAAGAGELLASTLIALLVLLAVRRWSLPEPRWVQEWLGLERLVHLSLVRPTVRLARGLAWVDDHLVDAAVSAVGSAALELGRRLARDDDAVLDGAVTRIARSTSRWAALAGRIDDAGVDGSVETVAARVRSLGELARRPQTGQLHQYYVQAAAVLAAGILLLVVVR